MFIERLHCSYSVREDQALYTVACELALARTVRLRNGLGGHGRYDGVTSSARYGRLQELGRTNCP